MAEETRKEKRKQKVCRGSYRRPVGSFSHPWRLAHEDHLLLLRSVLLEDSPRSSLRLRFRSLSFSPLHLFFSYSLLEQSYPFLFFLPLLFLRGFFLFIFFLLFIKRHWLYRVRCDTLLILFNHLTSSWFLPTKYRRACRRYLGEGRLKSLEIGSERLLSLSFSLSLSWSSKALNTMLR